MAVRVSPTDSISAPLETGSHELFEAAFRRHHLALLQYLRRRVRNDADARDIAQEAYLRLLRYRTNQDLNSLKALLFRIASNLVGMRARTARLQLWDYHQPIDEEECPLPCTDAPHDRRLIGQQQLETLMRTIERLPPKCQQAFVLSRFHNKSYPEIAALCRISVKMVEKHITHALAICRAEVGGESS